MKFFSKLYVLIKFVFIKNARNLTSWRRMINIVYSRRDRFGKNGCIVGRLEIQTINLSLISPLMKSRRGFVVFQSLTNPTIQYDLNVIEKKEDSTRDMRKVELFRDNVRLLSILYRVATCSV